MIKIETLSGDKNQGFDEWWYKMIKIETFRSKSEFSQMIKIEILSHNQNGDFQNQIIKIETLSDDQNWDSDDQNRASFWDSHRW